MSNAMIPVPNVSPGEAHHLHELVKANEARKRYKIVRGYFSGGRRTIARGLTLAEAQAHCQNPETSSSTATSAAARRRTKLKGPWFDGYSEE